MAGVATDSDLLEAGDGFAEGGSSDRIVLATIAQETVVGDDELWVLSVARCGRTSETRAPSGKNALCQIDANGHHCIDFPFHKGE